MTESSGKHIILVAAFLVSIFGVGVAQAIIEISQGERPQLIELFLEKPTEKTLRRFEKDIEDSSWFSQKLQPYMRYLQYMALRDAGDKALLGRDKWLFYKQGIQYLIEPWPPRNNALDNINDPVPAILSFRDQLAERGIELLILPAPGKASIYPDKLTSRANHSNHCVYKHTRNLIEKLKEQNIHILDLFENFIQRRNNSTDVDYYLSQDTHWSPGGMRLAAQSVAQEIIKQKWATTGDYPYALKSINISRHGDVLKMMDMPLLNHSFTPESINCLQVIDSDTGKPYTDDPHSEILVLGDSFLRIYERDEPGSAGFIAHLAHELKMPLASIISDGGASTLVRQQLKSKPELIINKKLVVWEFVERDIRFGMEGWKQVSLPKALDSSTTK